MYGMELVKWYSLGDSSPTVVINMYMQHFQLVSFISIDIKVSPRSKYYSGTWI